MASETCPWDPSSFSRPDQLIVTDVHLEWDVNFASHVLSGFAQLRLERKQIAVDKVVLDSRELNIVAVKHVESGNDLQFSVGKPVASFGSPLEVHLPNSSDQVYTLKISYEASPKSSALQWLKPEQTAGKRLPYLFSQCEAIHARSILPCQDTPSVKAPYTAKVTVPQDLKVLMSAVREGDPIVISNDKKQFTFTQKIPIPSYLIAIVVGALESRKISERIDVWSEVELVDKAAYEFAEAETMLHTAEEIVGPYLWGRYDILVLPPSFPFGGMENPCLTFVTPTLLAGDRSLANVIAHEIAHSWTGNLVTNKSFEHFWLNEGFTVFLERKIAGRMYGEKHRQFLSIGGWKELKDIIKTLGEENPLTNLVVNLNGVDPDDAFSTVPYEKGYAFLYYLEQTVGGQEIFETFLRSYIEEYKFKSVDTETWKKCLLEFFKDSVKVQKMLQTIDWEKWLHRPGMPPDTNTYDTSMEDACRKLCNRWLQADTNNLNDFSAADIASMSSIQIQEFLALLLEQELFPVAKLQAMETAYGMNSIMTNSEIRFRWLRLCLENHFKEAISLSLQFVNAQGRMKFVRPIYRALYAWEESRPLAIENFQQHRDEMMYMTAQCVAKELCLDH